MSRKCSACALTKTKAMNKFVGMTNPSWPGLGWRKVVNAAVANRTIAAKTGVNAKATARGAVQFTDPEKDHCIGNRSSSRKRPFAQMDMAASTKIVRTAMQAWIIGQSLHLHIGMVGTFAVGGSGRQISPMARMLVRPCAPTIT